MSLILAALLFVHPAFAEDVWATQDAQSVRFEGESLPGPLFKLNSKLEVLFRSGPMVRVRAADKFGWVSATVLTADKPEGAVDLPSQLLPGQLPPGLQLQLPPK